MSVLQTMIILEPFATPTPGPPGQLHYQDGREELSPASASSPSRSKQNQRPQQHLTESVGTGVAVHQLQRADHPRKPTPHHRPQAENDPRRAEQNRPSPQALGRLSYLGNLIHATQPDHRLGRNAVQVEEVEKSAVGRQQNR